MNGTGATHAITRPRIAWFVVLAAAALAAGWLFGAARASAVVTCNKTWDGGGGDNNWSTANNWDLNTLPTSGSVVCINNPATVHFDVNVLAANRTIDTLNGTGSLSIDANTLTILNGTNGGTEGQIANLTFAGGSLSGLNGATPTGQLKVGTAMSVSSATTLNGVVLDVAGATTWSAGSISYANSSQLNNSGVFTDATLSAISMPFGQGLFDNKAAGTYTKTGATLTTISVPFLNDGTVNVNNGELDIASSGPSGGTTPDGGVYNAASGKTLGFTNGTRKLAPTGGNSNPSIAAAGAAVIFGGSGTEVDGTFTAGSTTVISLGSATLKGAITTTTLAVNSGTMRVDHHVSGATISLDSGTLGGSGTVDVTAGDTFTWNNFSTIGTNEGGTVNIPATSFLNITGNQQHNMNGSTINNHGTAEWLAGDFEMANGAVINNTGDFFIQTDHEMLCCGGVGTAFNNNGGLVFKLSTSGTTLWQTPFTNTGTVEIQSGTINFQGALQSYDNATNTLAGGSFFIDSPATMEMFSADIHTIGANTSLTLSGPTSMIIDASNTSNDGLRNLATVQSTGVLDIQNGRDLSVPNGLSDAGSVGIGSGDTLTLTTGTLQVTSTGFLRGFGTVAGPVTNAGVVSPGMQPGDIGDLTIEGAYTQASGGVLRIEVEFTGSGEYDRLLVNGHPVTLSGTIEVVNINPFVPSDGETITPLEYGTRSGQFATVLWTVPAGLTATAVYHPTSADIVVGPAASLGIPSMTKPTGAFQNKRTKFAVAWTAVSGTNVKYDVQMRSAQASTGVFGSFSQIKTGLNTLTFNFQGTQGTTYCFEARASMGATHSAFSSQKCTAVPFDDRALTRPAGTHWQAKKLFGYYLNTFLLTKTHNDSLTKAGVHGKTIAVVAEVCPSCGAISVTFGGTTKGFDLHAATTKREVLFVVDTGAMHTGTVTIKVTSTNKNIQIDGLGASPL